MRNLSRRQAIVELAHEGPLPNQQERCKVLARRGIQVTQATLSRDLNELRLVKTSEGYILPNGNSSGEPLPDVSRLVQEFVREVRRGPNPLGFKTTPGRGRPGGWGLDYQSLGGVGGGGGGGGSSLLITAGHTKSR